MANAPITILYEDEDVIAIDKPAGLLVHAGEGSADADTVVAWFLAHVPEARGVGEPGALPSGRDVDRSGIVHRLDRETSGVMVLAKHQQAFEHLKAEFHDRKAIKEYRAFAHGTFDESWGTIERPIGRSNKDFRLRSAQRGARGLLRPATTEWEKLGEDGTHTYLKVLPKTGRTHQIRVHLKAVNHPIVCDLLYAPNHPCDLGFDRLALHAYALELTLPSGTITRFEAPLPAAFEAAAASMQGMA